MVAVQEGGNAGFRFERLLVREVVFRDGSDSAAREPIGNLAIELEVATSVADDQSSCSCRLAVVIKNGPFKELSAAIEGRFVKAQIASSVRIEDFARTHAPAILMPFVRAEIAAVTRGSRFGQVLLPPINVVAITEGVAHTSEGASK